METNLKKFNKKLLHFNINCVCWCLTKQCLALTLLNLEAKLASFEKARLTEQERCRR